jgi:signal transduction histidine kinase
VQAVSVLRVTREIVPRARRLQYGIVIFPLVAAAYVIAISPLNGLISPLAAFLLVTMIASNISAPSWGIYSHSGVFMCALVAAALLGPGAAAILVGLAELSAGLWERIRLFAGLVNALGSVVPTLCVGLVIGGPIAGGELKSGTCELMLIAGVMAALFSWITTPTLVAWYDRAPIAGTVMSVEAFAHTALSTIVPAIGIVAITLNVGKIAAVLIVPVMASYNRSTRSVVHERVLAERAALLAESRQRLVAQSLDAEDRERRRLAETLHDGAIQSLLVAQHDLADGRSEVRERAGEAVGQAIAELRGTVFDLHPAVLGQAGLSAAVEAVAEQQGRRGAFAAVVEVDPSVQGVNDELVLSLARELLINAAKHARAANVRCRIVPADGGGVLLEVEDDGVGIDEAGLADAVARGHIGLASARERVAVLGGSFEFETTDGSGTIVRIVVPRPEQTEQTEDGAGFPESGQQILAHRRPGSGAAGERSRARL